MEIYDKAGQLLAIGDDIVFASPYGMSLRCAKVTGFTPTGQVKTNDSIRKRVECSGDVLKITKEQAQTSTNRNVLDDSATKKSKKSDISI